MISESTLTVVRRQLFKSLPPRFCDSCRGRLIWAWTILLVFSLGSSGHSFLWQEPADSERSSQTQEESLEASADPADEEDPEASAQEDTEEGEEESERPTRSGYEDIPKGGGPTSVEADLHADDQLKRPLFRILRATIEPLYRFKDRVNGIWGIAFGVDYNFLNQYASFSFTDDQATDPPQVYVPPIMLGNRP